MSAGALADAMHLSAELEDLQGRAGYYAMLRFSEDTQDPGRGAEMMKVQERGTAIAAKLVFLELEWAALPDAAGSTSSSPTPSSTSARTTCARPAATATTCSASPKRCC